MVEMTMCNQNLKWGVLDYRGFLVREQKANARLYACYDTARRVTGNGSYSAP